MKMRLFLSGLAAVCIGLIAVQNFAFAGEKSPVILTISVPQAQDGDPHQITLSEQDLRALPAMTYQTTTIWTSGEQRFTGVPLLVLIEHFGIEAKDLELKAVNDYAITLPVAELTEDAPIIAYERNGKPMKLRDNGPLWVLYNYDANPDYRTETIYSRSIWQLDRMTAVR
ncbi:hypothetical protein SAMN05444414_101336 [Roseovarius marisflavi]|uniref:Oxidoreductase molybdopterin-binding domain-containing protein n=1 Tax=Roseovarius marisflavi TaxID=1054996 RepID=A0A1M6VJ01_9RHOB|nr:molybdopterin-dependent oxidoreductase [Roseovarius marisflavi]SHK81334.1 hypothetical protein SAMN05444414_101336 [Roseovarius marisflavi]